MVLSCRTAETSLHPAWWLDRRLQHPGAALGARDAQPGRIPGGAAHAKLLAVSRKMGSTPRLLTDDAIRISRAMNRRSHDLIERSRRRIAESQTWPVLDPDKTRPTEC